MNFRRKFIPKRFQKSAPEKAEKYWTDIIFRFNTHDLNVALLFKDKSRQNAW